MKPNLTEINIQTKQDRENQKPLFPELQGRLFAKGEVKRIGVAEGGVRGNTANVAFVVTAPEDSKAEFVMVYLTAYEILQIADILRK